MTRCSFSKIIPRSFLFINGILLEEEGGGEEEEEEEEEGEEEKSTSNKAREYVLLKSFQPEK